MYKTCLFCKKNFYIKETHKSAYKRKFCNVDCYQSFLNSREIKNYRKQALKIFIPICSICSTTTDLCVHHIDLNPLNNPRDGSNWYLVCKSHHGKIHYLRKTMSHIKACKLMINEQKLANKNLIAKKINLEYCIKKPLIIRR